MSITPRENYIRALTCNNPEWVPFAQEDTMFVGMVPNTVIEMPLGNGQDQFGVTYVGTPDGTLPDNRIGFLLDDITKWKEVVKIPNLDDYPWELWAEKEAEMAPPGSEDKARYALINNGIFDRLIALMGFEEGLMALLEEPECCEEFFSAIADHKVKYIEKLHTYFKPDIIQYVDDLAHANGLFMNPETYRKLIKPHHQRVIDAIHSRPGVVAVQHTCGKCQDLIGDYVDLGVEAWFSVQEVNDIKAIKERFAGRLAIEYSLDGEGVINNPDVSEEVLHSEIHRAIKEYGFDGGLTFFPVVLGVPFEELITGQERRLKIVREELARLRKGEK